MVRRVRADRERQSMAIHNRHDFHAFSALRSSDFQPATLGHNEGCVDEAFFFVQGASVAKLVGNIRQHATQNLIAAPSLKAPMHSFVVRVALRQHVPLHRALGGVPRGSGSCTSPAACACAARPGLLAHPDEGYFRKSIKATSTRWPASTSPRST